MPELRDLSGNDRRVVNYLKRQPEAQETLRRLVDLIEYLLPLYKAEGKTYVSIAIGCTGGRHRSVMMTNAITRLLRKKGFNAGAIHRDVRKANRKKLEPQAKQVKRQAKDTITKASIKS